VNHNWALDPGDSRRGEFRIWRYANGDSISGTDEVETLDEIGIASIGLMPSGPAQSVADGSANG